MRFLIDCQLPRTLATRLRAVGCSADHLFDLGLAGEPDGVIWQFATRETYCIVTKDEDFSHLVKTSASGPSVIWIRFGNTRNAALWERISPLLVQIVSLIDAGERLIEVR